MSDFDNRLIHDMNRNGAWVVVLLLVVAAIAVGLGYTWGEDNAIERLQARQAEVTKRERSLKLDTSAAFSDGWVEGRESISCLGGFRIDARTGMEVRRVAEVKP